MNKVSEGIWDTKYKSNQGGMVWSVFTEVCKHISAQDSFQNEEVPVI